MEFLLFYLASKVVRPLVEKLPSDLTQKLPSSEVVVNICGVLNNLVTTNINAARDITESHGLEKLMNIRDSTDHRFAHFPRLPILNVDVVDHNFALSCHTK